VFQKKFTIFTQNSILIILKDRILISNPSSNLILTGILVITEICGSLLSLFETGQIELCQTFDR